MTNLRYALRTIRHHRLYSAINIVGLALSLACTIILVKYVFRESTVNHFITDLDKVYYQTMDNKRHPYQMYGCPVFQINDQRIDLAEQTGVEVLTNMDITTTSVAFTDMTDTLNQVRIVVADSNLLKVIDFPLLTGDPHTALDAPGNAIVSSEFAHRIWGSEQPIGHTVKALGGEFTVVAVAAPTRTASSLEFDIIANFKPDGWYGHRVCMMRLAGPEVAQRLNDLFATNTTPDVSGQAIGWGLQPYADYHFDGVGSSWFTDNMLQGNRNNVRILMVVALLLLGVGLFNFINIYTVMLLRRGRELNVQRVFGASLSNLMGLLLAENFIMVGAATALALAIVGTVADFSSSLLGVPVSLNLSFDVPLVVGVLVSLPLITVIYPWRKYRKMQRPTGGSATGGSVSARAVFMVAQYVMSIVLIIGSIFFMRQLNYLLDRDLGFDYHGVIRSSLPSAYRSPRPGESFQDFAVREQTYHAALRSRLEREPAIESFTIGFSPMDDFDKYNTSLRALGSNDGYLNIGLIFMNAGADRFYDLELVDGDYLSDTLDKSLYLGVLLNESAARLLGVKQGDFIEYETKQWQDTPNYPSDDRRREVLGVMRDYSPQHLSIATPPLLLQVAKDRHKMSTLYSRYTPGRAEQAIVALKQVYDELSGGDGDGGFKYSMLEDEILSRYADEKRTSKVYITFAVIAILISSMGLLGLSLYDVRQRYREIALRRVNGATVGQIIALLLRRYYMLLIMAFVIAVPLAGWGIELYLADFATRAPLSWWIFAVAALITGVISLGTLLFQSRRAANENPVKALKIS